MKEALSCCIIDSHGPLSDTVQILFALGSPQIVLIFVELILVLAFNKCLMEVSSREHGNSLTDTLLYHSMSHVCTDMPH